MPRIRLSELMSALKLVREPADDAAASGPGPPRPACGACFE